MPESLNSLLSIRPEQPGDERGIYRVHEEAFGGSGEARLVDDLRTNGNLFLSLVAVVRKEVVGHLAFSPVVVEAVIEADAGDKRGEGPSTIALGLAPVGVLPEYQRKGIGAALVRAGLAACERRGHPLVIVLGDPAYYRPFGFTAARPFGVGHPFGPDVPDEAFMLRFAGEEFPENVCGLVRYAPEFYTLG